MAVPIDEMIDSLRYEIKLAKERIKSLRERLRKAESASKRIKIKMEIDYQAEKLAENQIKLEKMITMKQLGKSEYSKPKKPKKKSNPTRLSNPILGIATPWWIIGGIVGFVYMRNRLRAVFGPHNVPSEYCPDCVSIDKQDATASMIITENIPDVISEMTPIYMTELDWILRKGR